jgi:hypothetical protein
MTLAVFLPLYNCWYEAGLYISPQILGHWWLPGAGIEQRIAELIGGRGYNFWYMPPLVTLLAVIGPYSGFVPASQPRISI